MRRRLAPIAAAAGALLWPGAAQADPIVTPIIAYLLTSAGIATSVSVIGLTINIASVLSAVVVTAIGIGISLLFAPKPPKPPPPENGTFPFQQAIPGRIFAYGRARIGGANVLLESPGATLHQVIAVCAHRIHAFVRFYLNDDAVAIAGHYAQPGDDGRYGGALIYTDNRLGLVPETAYAIPELGGLWTANHRGDGVASMYWAFSAGPSSSYSKYYPYGRPQPSAVIDAALIYDWRDVTQSLDDPASWKFSTNVALCIAHFICFNEFGPQRAFAAAIAPVIEQWTLAADDCDDAMPLRAGGSEPRYRCGGWITTEQDPRATLQTLLNCCDGWLVQRGDGTVVLVVGKYHAPGVALTDADISGFYLQSDIGTEDKINYATATYTFPDGGYASVETDPVIDTADQALRPGPPRAARHELPWVQWTGQASRLLHREVYRQKQGVRGKLYLRLSGINACYERLIQLNSNALPTRLRNVVIENRKANFSLSEQSCEIDFIACSDAIDAFDPALDESRPPVLPDKPAAQGLPKPANVSAVPEEIADAAGGISIYLAVSWDQATANGAVRTDLTYRIHWRLHDAGGGTAGPWTDQGVSLPTASGARWKAATGTVPPGTQLDLEVASIGTLGTLSDWSTTQLVDTAPATTAPAPPTTLTATGASGHADLSAKAPNSPNFDALRFYRSAHGSPFNTATPLATPIYGAANATLTATDTTSAGTYDYWVTAQNAAGVSSSPTGPITATIT
jgi:hypothetical protein